MCESQCQWAIHSASIDSLVAFRLFTAFSFFRSSILNALSGRSDLFRLCCPIFMNIMNSIVLDLEGLYEYTVAYCESNEGQLTWPSPLTLLDVSGQLGFTTIWHGCKDILNFPLLFYYKTCSTHLVANFTIYKQVRSQRWSFASKTCLPRQGNGSKLNRLVYPSNTSHWSEYNSNKLSDPIGLENGAKYKTIVYILYISIRLGRKLRAIVGKASCYSAWI